MKRYCLALDLKDDAQLIGEYEDWHKKVPRDIQDSITAAGITEMEIYRVGNRMFMIMETVDDFDFAKKAAMDAGNSSVQDWEELMWKYQQALPGARAGEKWMLMDKIFHLKTT